VTGFSFRGFDHVQLAMPPGGEDAAEAFYSGVLGLERVPKPGAMQARGGCWFRGEAIELHLGVEDDFAPARKAHPALSVAGLSALEARLQKVGHPVRSDVPLGGRRRFHTEDPFGNRLELIEAAS